MLLCCYTILGFLSYWKKEQFKWIVIQIPHSDYSYLTSVNLATHDFLFKISM